MPCFMSVFANTWNVTKKKKELSIQSTWSLLPKMENEQGYPFYLSTVINSLWPSNAC